MMMINIKSPALLSYPSHLTVRPESGDTGPVIKIVCFPELDTPIVSRAGQDGLVMGRPLDLGGIIESVNPLIIQDVYLENLVLVALEAVQFELEVPEVPERHSLVRRAGGEDEL